MGELQAIQVRARPPRLDLDLPPRSKTRANLAVAPLASGVVTFLTATHGAGSRLEIEPEPHLDLERRPRVVPRKILSVRPRPRIQVCDS